MKRRLLTGILTAAAVAGLVSIASAAETLEYTAPDGDKYEYEVNEKGVKITSVVDDGDKKVVVPKTIADTNVYRIDIHKTSVSDLDVRQCTALTILSCYQNKLTGLDLSSNTALSELYCDSN